MSYARRKDLSHKPIVDELRARGFVVFDVSGLPSLGFDILVYGDPFDLPFDLTLMPGDKVYIPTNEIRIRFTGKWMPFELKTPARSYERKGRKTLDRQQPKLTKSEQQAQSKAPIPVASCVEDILKYF